jgi:2-polyprenyl-3-methyl-5-hydroxy-6-metoxy-1,4-benzoquinol methylase
MKEAKDHYNSVAESYNEQYDKNNLCDISRPYPANYFRMQLLLNTFAKHNIRRAIEVGVGDGTPLMTLSKSGVDVYGFDVSEKMVEEAKKNADACGMRSDQIFVGDIQDPNTYMHSIRDGKFDGLIAMGVMPHVQNDNFVMSNMNNLLESDGIAFVEFRNALFSMFTLNRNTVDFFVNDLLSDANDEFKKYVEDDLNIRLRTDQPPMRKKLEDGAPGYDAILSKFHNPMTIHELFEKNGFEVLKIHWYHYHPAMPYLSLKNPELFRAETIKMENESSGWKGYFLCSAFVVEARKYANI